MQVASQNRLEAGEVLKVGAPLVGGLLGAWGILSALQGRSERAQLALFGWAIITAFGSAATALQEVEDRRQIEVLRREVAELRVVPGAAASLGGGPGTLDWFAGGHR